MAIETDTLLQKLINWGCDIEGVMDRFLGEKELYRSCLETVVNDASFEELKNALEEQNVKTGFEAAHTLKGVLANMGLTPMYEVTVKIVEPLRAGVATGLYPFYEDLIEKNSYLRKLLELE